MKTAVSGYRSRRTARTMFALALLLLLPLSVPVAAAPPTGQWRVPGPATKRYIGQAARLTARIPAFWTVNAANNYDYSGPDGFVVSQPLAGPTLREVCVELASNPVIRFDARGLTITTWRDRPACTFTSVAGPARGSVAAKVIVIPQPHPFTLLGMQMPYVMLAADPAHFPAILASVSFDLTGVTPQEYVASVMDIVQGRSLYRDKIDRRQQRALARTTVTDWDQAHAFIHNLVATLGFWGDNHSQVWSPETISYLTMQRPGFGLMVVGNTVVQVNPDGPAAHAGIMAGDRIVTVDGGAVFGPAVPQDLSLRFPNATALTLAILHPETGKRFTVTLHQGTYDPYLPPTGRRLSHGIGYIEIFSTQGQESRVNYAKAALSIIAGIEQQPTCGWVVDLRSNSGGGYAPMVQGLAPLLGEGTIFGFVVPNGPTDWISIHGGAIYQDGSQLFPPVPDAPITTLKEPNSPVAVLVGPSTASAAEVTTMAFIGRDQTRLFGSSTAGATTGNDGFPLIDGYELVLATAREMDRSGHVYTGSIAPDETVYTKTSDFGTPNDAVITAATGWLSKQPACRAMKAPPTPAS